jgi:sialic acid synthase SpsE
VTIDVSLEGPDADVSLTFEDLAVFVSQARDLSQALSVRKNIHPREREIREWAHRSLVYTKSLSAGQVLEPGDIWSKRPGTGVPARHRNQFIGRRLLRAVDANTLLSASDFED